MLRKKLGEPDNLRKTELDGHECTVRVYNRIISRGTELSFVKMSAENKGK